MTKGETGSISATVVPVGTPITWGTDNPNIATVSDGIVTAVNAGDATISAKITVDGVEYSDTCSVTVNEPLEPWESVDSLTSEHLWIDSTKWLKKDYTDNTRQTYYTYDESTGELRLTYDPNGSQTTLFLDLQPAPAIVDLDTDNYEYALYLGYDGGTSDMDNSLVTLTTNGENVFVADGWSEKTLGELRELAPEGQYLPLSLKNAQGTRLFTMQVKKNGELQNDAFYYLADISLYRRAK